MRQRGGKGGKQYRQGRKEKVIMGVENKEKNYFFVKSLSKTPIGAWERYKDIKI